jgi:hypothetical protein
MDSVCNLRDFDFAPIALAIQSFSTYLFETRADHAIAASVARSGKRHLASGIDSRRILPNAALKLTSKGPHHDPSDCSAWLENST